MKQKTISKIIRAKMNAWLDTISDEKLRAEVKESIIVTGGCIASLFLKEEIRDFDVYISNRDVCKRLCEYYTEGLGIKVLVAEDIENLPEIESIDRLDDDQVYCLIRSDGVMKRSAEKDKPYDLIYITANAITLTDSVQIVTRFTGEPKDIHHNYDFIHATNYWTFDEGLIVNVEAMCSLITKELRYSGSRYPLCSVIRTRKFISRGWSVTAGQYLKMIMQLNDLNLKNINVLREQLIGVDSAYFTMFLNAISGESEGDFSATYLCKVIDEVFEVENIGDQS